MKQAKILCSVECQKCGKIATVPLVYSPKTIRFLKQIIKTYGWKSTDSCPCICKECTELDKEQPT